MQENLIRSCWSKSENVSTSFCKNGEIFSSLQELIGPVRVQYGLRNRPLKVCYNQQPSWGYLWACGGLPVISPPIYFILLGLDIFSPNLTLQYTSPFQKLLEALIKPVKGPQPCKTAHSPWNLRLKTSSNPSSNPEKHLTTLQRTRCSELDLKPHFLE